MLQSIAAALSLCDTCNRILAVAASATSLPRSPTGPSTNKQGHRGLVHRTSTPLAKLPKLPHLVEMPKLKLRKLPHRTMPTRNGTHSGTRAVALVYGAPLVS